VIQRPVDRRAVLVESVASELMFGAVIPALCFRSSQSFLVASRLSHLFACEPCAPVDRSGLEPFLYMIMILEFFSVEYSWVYILFLTGKIACQILVHSIILSCGNNTRQKWKARGLSTQLFSFAATLVLFRFFRKTQTSRTLSDKEIERSTFSFAATVVL